MCEWITISFKSLIELGSTWIPHCTKYCKFAILNSHNIFYFHNPNQMFYFSQIIGSEWYLTVVHSCLSLVLRICSYSYLNFNFSSSEQLINNGQFSIGFPIISLNFRDFFIFLDNICIISINNDIANIFHVFQLWTCSLLSFTEHKSLILM